MFYSNEWPSSALYSKLNGDSFLTNANYISSDWENKIATTNWKYGDTTSINYTAYNMYSIENKFSKSVSAKIGLMYLHDYYYAYQSGGLNCSQNGSYSLCKNSWIHKSNCAPNVDTGFIDEASFEFTMIRHGGADSLNGVSIWKIGEDGVVETNTSSVVSENRPVFYLKSTVNYVSGTGTASDPFIIS